MNADKIRYVESTPDTVVCCDTGDRIMVKEDLKEVTRRAIESARIIRRPITGWDANRPVSEPLGGVVPSRLVGVIGVS